MAFGAHKSKVRLKDIEVFSVLADAAKKCTRQKNDGVLFFLPFFPGKRHKMQAKQKNLHPGALGRGKIQISPVYFAIGRER